MAIGSKKFKENCDRLDHEDESLLSSGRRLRVVVRADADDVAVVETWNEKTNLPGFQLSKNNSGLISTSATSLRGTKIMRVKFNWVEGKNDF